MADIITIKIPKDGKPQKKGKVKPCPFCGCTPEIIITICKSNNFTSYKVECTEFACFVNPSTKLSISESAAVTRWNKRK
jgi:hypothetical protein